MVLAQALRHYPGPPLISQELTIFRSAWHEPMEADHQVDRPEGTGDTLFMLFHEHCQIDGASYPPWTLRCWPHAAAHRYGSPHALWHHSWIHCSGPLADALAAALPSPVTLRDPEPLSRHLRHLVEDVVLDRDPELAVLGVRALLRCIERRHHADDGVPAEWRALRVWLEHHAHETIALDDLASRMGLAKSRFSERFTAYFTMPPLRFVQHLRLERARWLLRDHRRRVADVAREVGYEDVAYFSRLARKRLGVSPRRLRDG
jgi:AraC-like DNA-binding protein